MLKVYNFMQNEEEKETKILNASEMVMNTDDDRRRMVIIPQCCREGWESCPHVINRKTKPSKRNIGL